MQQLVGRASAHVDLSCMRAVRALFSYRATSVQMAYLPLKALIVWEGGNKYKVQATNWKSADWLALCGPALKYILCGLLPHQQQAVLFRYIDVLNRIWSYTLSGDDIDDLLSDCRSCLAEMEIAFPAWELDINRHMVLHLVEAIKVLLGRIAQSITDGPGPRRLPQYLSRNC